MELYSSTLRVAIIGRGVSGTFLALQLLRHARRPLQLFLIERAEADGVGVAYGTRCPDHVLNVPGGRMGAFPEEPDHFFRWLRARAGSPGFPREVSASDYVPRHLYGRYVQELLAETRANLAPETRIEDVRGEAIDVEEEPHQLLIRLADGGTVAADQLVLAIGNLPGEYPIPRPLPVYRTPRYVHIPWRREALEGLSDDESVLLVGQGLAATDLMVQLARRGHRGVIHAVSRHGQPPQVHDPASVPRAFGPLEAVPPTARAWTRRVREEIAAAANDGADWRAVIDGLRPHTQGIWQALSGEERARFLRHVRPFWEAHRHRIAPETAAVVNRLVAAGRLQFHAGRLQSLEANEHGVQALLRRRGTIQHVSLQVAKVINCTGPRTDYTKYQDPLLVHLLARGLIDHDPLALGINALPSGEVVRYRGEPLERVFTLGPPLQGVLWESTAVPEIREQAAALAERLLARAEAAQPLAKAR